MAKGTCIPVQSACLSDAALSRLGTICHTSYCQFTPREAPGACGPEMMTEMKSREYLLDIADWGKRVPICHQEKGQYTVRGSPMSEGKSQALLTLSERSTAFYQLLLPKHAQLNGRLPTNSFEEIERSALFHFSYVLSSSRLTWSLLHVKAGSIVCNHEKCVTKHIFHIFPSSGTTPHKIMMFQVQRSSDRIWCNTSRLVSAFCVSIMGHGRSSFLFRVSANQWDDEDTIRNTLGRTVKIVNKRGHERGHGHGKECLLCYGCVVGKDLHVYFPFYGDWLKLGSVDSPIKGHHTAHWEYQGNRVNNSVFLTIPFKHECEDLLLLLNFKTWLHRSVYILRNMTHSLWVISKKKFLFHAINKRSYLWSS